jgi:hypothetical protein
MLIFPPPINIPSPEELDLWLLSYPPNYVYPPREPLARFIVSVRSAHHDLLFLWGRLTMIYCFCGVGSLWFIISVRGRLTMIYYFFARAAHYDLLFL